MFESTKFTDSAKKLTATLERLHNFPEELTKTERETLAECEHVIGRGLETFVQVGRSLMTIRDRRLYRKSYETFDDYCNERWRVSSSRARQYIAASLVVANVESVTNVTLQNEAQARVLAPHAEDIQKGGYADCCQHSSGG
jgi:glutamyl-tRNA reductase